MRLPRFETFIAGINLSPLFWAQLFCIYISLAIAQLESMYNKAEKIENYFIFSPETLFTLPLPPPPPLLL